MMRLVELISDNLLAGTSTRTTTELVTSACAFFLYWVKLKAVSTIIGMNTETIKGVQLMFCVYNFCLFIKNEGEEYESWLGKQIDVR